ncbi:hypothetical protein [Lentzea nigeriaca]|uniref:hypothetical protein n=1 Tax=Lentzea nigeriaca TaxID=1128665 RepID=UPI00195CEF1A|nr:hypothetical protein [Lentzea nigeriaca]MBM7862515.1 ABC-type glycerol-3-phosphate transport system substrate-binding protein [Lentzea nigeriaca]
MKFAKMVSAAAITLAALTALGTAATASAAGNDDVSILTWRVVDGPFPGNEEGRQDCYRTAADYQQAYGWKTGCLLEADSNQYFVWADL